MVELRGYIDELGHRRFADWLDGLNPVGAAKVTTARARMEKCNLSNVKSVSSGVFEYRIDWGPGYLIYFGKDGNLLIILIGGGTKTWNRQGRGGGLGGGCRGQSDCRRIEGLEGFERRPDSLEHPD